MSVAPAIIERFRGLAPAQRAAAISLLSPEQCLEVLYEWPLWARPNQLPPAGDWVIWLILAGRGFGKTRCGAEWVRDRAWAMPGSRGHLIAPDAGDARDTMVEGESGILAVSPPWFMPLYEPSKRRLTWPNGTRATLYSSEEPESLRGPQCHWFWADELAAWTYLLETWDQLSFGFRLSYSRNGKIMQPQGVITTTPKPLPTLREIIADPATIVTRGGTYENRANLAASFFAKIVKRYEGTRLGRQELEGALLEDNPGALWQMALIDAQRRKQDEAVTLMESCEKIAVGIDPAVTNSETSAETGIIVVGRKGDRGFVFDDATLKASPNGWAKEAIRVFDKWKADRVVPEINNGGDMVSNTLWTLRAELPVHVVRATRGKKTRAEPIAALYEQGKISHVGSFTTLEDQMTTWDPSDEKQPSPDRVDALVWGLSYLFNEHSAEPGVRSL